MPTIYLSPSIQPYNKYLTEGDEQYWMNRIADDMVPMLEQNGINVVLQHAEHVAWAGNTRIERRELRFAFGAALERRAVKFGGEAARAGCVLLSVQRFRQARGGAYCR